MYFKNNWWYVDEQHSKDRILNENYVYGDTVINLGMTEIIESWYEKNLKKKTIKINLIIIMI